MSPAKDNWIPPCAFISIIIGTLISLIAPPIGIIFLIITLSLLGIIYLAITVDSEARYSERGFSHIAPSSEPEVSIRTRTSEDEATRIRIQDTGTHTIPTSPSPKPVSRIRRQSKIKHPDSSKPPLQVRIDRLEKQVKQLRQRLSEEPLIKPTAPDSLSKEEVSQEEDIEEDVALLERAVQQILVTLDQKLEKGSISHPLYNRLRNKYLTRLKKVKGRRVVATQPE